METSAQIRVYGNLEEALRVAADYDVKVNYFIHKLIGYVLDVEGREDNVENFASEMRS